jgi:hypothetical protein
MTVDERFEQLERKTQRLEQRDKRLTVALTATGKDDRIIEKGRFRSLAVADNLHVLVSRLFFVFNKVNITYVKSH